MPTDIPQPARRADPPPATDPSPASPDNTAVSGFTWTMLAVSFAAMAAIPAVSVVFLALSAAIGLFALSRKLGWIGNKWEGAVETAAIAVFVLSIVALLGLWGWGYFSATPPPPPPPVDIYGAVTVDGQPATEGEVHLMGGGLTDNRRLFSQANPGHFQFKGVTGLGKTVLLKIDVDRPVDLAPELEEYPVEPGEPMVIRLTAPPVPEPPPPPPTGPPAPIAFGDASAPLPPFLHDAPAPLKARFVGREAELAELDAAWESVLSQESGESAPSAPLPTRTVGVIAWGGFGKTTLVRQWLWRQFQGGDPQPIASATESHPRTSPRATPDAAAPDALFWRGFQAGQGADAFARALIAYFAQRPDLRLADLPKDAGQRLAKLRRAIGGTALRPGPGRAGGGTERHPGGGTGAVAVQLPPGAPAGTHRRAAGAGTYRRHLPAAPHRHRPGNTLGNRKDAAGRPIPGGPHPPTGPLSSHGPGTPPPE